MLIKTKNNNADDEFIDLNKYIQVIKSKLLLAVMFSSVVVVVAAIWVMSITPTYKSTATLMIDAKSYNVVSIDTFVGVDTTKQEYFQTQYEIIRSSLIARKVIDRLGIGPTSSQTSSLNTDDYSSRLGIEVPSLSELKSSIKSVFYNLPLLDEILVRPREIGSEEILDFKKLEYLKEFKDHLKVVPIKNTQLVQVTFFSKDPELAAKVANAVGEVYIENDFELQEFENNHASEWISSRLTELQSRLRESETKLFDFMNQEGLVDVSGIDSLATTELNKLIDQVSVARDRRLASESLLSVLKQGEKVDPSYYYNISQVMNNPQMRDIRLNEIQAEKLVSELSKRYGPKHDKMIQASAQLKSLQERSRKTLIRMLSSIEKEFVTAQQQENSLKRELESKKAEFQSIALKRAEFETLKREVESNRKLYDLFLTRQKEYNATSDFKDSVAQIIERAEVPFVPAKPNKPLIVTGAAAGAFSFAMLLALIASEFRNTFERRADLSHRGNVSVFGSVPKLLGLDLSAPIPGRDDIPNSKAALLLESIRNIRTSLSIRSVDESTKCISFTSAIPGEGKSTIAANVASSMANLEKVLLIDGDLRRPSLSKRLGIDMKDPGLADYLLGEADLNSCIYRYQESELYILPAGQLDMENPQELFSSKTYRELIDRVSELFDRVIIDTPAVNSVIDPVLISAMTDGTIMVVKANSTQISQFKFAVGRLKEHNIKVLGAVLNHDESKTQDAYQFAGTYE